MRTDYVPGVRKIAVLRANALGDFIFSLPALAALRARYPHAEIVLLGCPWHADFLAGRESPIDRVEVVPPATGVREDVSAPGDPTEVDRFFERMAGEAFGIAIQMHGGGLYSNPFVQRLGARLTVGMKGPDAAPLDRWIPYVYYQHEYLRYLEVVSLVGATVVELAPRLNLMDSDLEEAHDVLGPLDRPLAVLNPGVSDFRRRWPEDRFAAIGDLLAATGFRVVISGRRDECGLAESVRAAMREPAENLAGRTSLGGLAGVLSLSAIVVSSDTGTLHLAHALDVPSVGIYWCGNLINGAPVTLGRHRAIGSWMTRCPACGEDVATPDRPPSGCDHPTCFVERVAVEDVASAVLDLISYCEPMPSSPHPPQIAPAPR